MAYSKEIKNKIIVQLKAGVPIKEIASISGIADSTIRKWSKLVDVINSKDALANIKVQLQHLTSLEPTESITKQIAMLSKALERLRRVVKSEIPKKQKRKPTIKDEKITKEIIQKALHSDYGLFEYQKRFIASQEQFEIVLKARQTGFSYSAGLKAVARAAGGRNQLFLSASEEQALILIKYAKLHCEKLDIGWDGKEKEIKINGSGTIKALAHNFRTAQGFSGDVWMDEFAWYPNPKQIWGAIVPSIGTVKGSLTIMSTPFEEQSLFYNLWHEEDKYFMFKRYKVDIYDAIKDGLEFDLEIMKALFDEDTWASAYECQFIDDDTSFFPISLIKSIVDPMLSYYLPISSAILKSGFDIGRKKDISALSAFEKNENIFTLAILDTLKKASFETQKRHIQDHFKLFPNAYMNIDMTGIGMNLAENIEDKYPNRASGVYFTASSKEIMTLNFKKAIEDKRIRIPNDPILISDIHSIKRKAGQRRMLYDSDRNAYGHADRFWASALALKDMDFMQSINGGESGKGGAYLF